MTYARLSPKFQIVIPKDIRRRIPLKVGQKLIVMEKDGVIYLIPEIPLKNMRGIFKGTGLDSKDMRDKQDRL